MQHMRCAVQGSRAYQCIHPGALDMRTCSAVGAAAARRVMPPGCTAACITCAPASRSHAGQTSNPCSRLLLLHMTNILHGLKMQHVAHMHGSCWSHCFRVGTCLTSMDVTLCRAANSRAQVMRGPVPIAVHPWPWRSCCRICTQAAAGQLAVTCAIWSRAPKHLQDPAFDLRTANDRGPGPGITLPTPTATCRTQQDSCACCSCCTD